MADPASGPAITAFRWHDPGGHPVQGGDDTQTLNEESMDELRIIQLAVYSWLQSVAKMAHMRITLDRRADRAGRLPLARQIQLHIERLIGQRLLGAGAKLPATRELARDLGVNRTTVALAYDELVAGGWARAHVGQGTFVADQVPAAEAPRAAAPRFDWTGLPVQERPGHRGGLRAAVRIGAAARGPLPA